SVGGSHKPWPTSLRPQVADSNSQVHRIRPCQKNYPSWNTLARHKPQGARSGYQQARHQLMPVPTPPVRDQEWKSQMSCCLLFQNHSLLVEVNPEEQLRCWESCRLLRREIWLCLGFSRVSSMYSRCAALNRGHNHNICHYHMGG